jgi:hypothetical protein
MMFKNMFLLTIAGRPVGPGSESGSVKFRYGSKDPVYKNLSDPGTLEQLHKDLPGSTGSPQVGEELWTMSPNFLPVQEPAKTEKYLTRKHKSLLS